MVKKYDPNNVTRDADIKITLSNIDGELDSVIVPKGTGRYDMVREALFEFLKFSVLDVGDSITIQEVE